MLNEAETMKKLVEKALQVAGWLPIVDYVRDYCSKFGAVRELETDNGPADYVLFIDGVAVAVVESKRLELGLRMFWFRLSGIREGLGVDCMILAISECLLFIRLIISCFGFRI